MPTAVVSSKGQIVIPREVRERMNIKQGDRVSFIVRPDGSAELRRAGRDVRELKKILPRYEGPPATLGEIRETIEQEAIRRSERR